MSDEKVKTITITVTSKEVDAVEDIIWCQNTDEQLEEMYPYLRTFWRKFASAFDDDPSSEDQKDG